MLNNFPFGNRNDINRITVEFKGSFNKQYIYQKCDINRITVEFKVVTDIKRNIVFSDINRITVEFKGVKFAGGLCRHI